MSRCNNGNNMKINRISIIANSLIQLHDDKEGFLPNKGGMSGGSRIFIECAKRWLDKGISIDVFTPDVGEKFCKYNGLNKANYVTWTSSKCGRLTKFGTLGIVALYIIGLVKGCLIILRKFQQVNKTIIYSSSDFWADSIPAFVARLRNKNAKWVASFYLFAPSPLSKTSPYKGRKFLRGLIYYLSQIPVYWLIKKYASMVWVTSESDRWRFINKRLPPEKVIAIRWGVDTTTPSTIPEPKEKKFDAVFIGRFHPQKGILELMDIWKLVCEKRPYAKLAIIGTGELEKDVREKIRKYRLENNVTLFGFKDGVEKLKIFKESMIVVHPATYDTGAIAPMEAISCGLPAVMFDLPAFRTYYPKGVIKVPKNNLRMFAESILNLLSNAKLYETLKEEAIQLTRELDWNKKADELLNLIRKVLDDSCG